jgi:hypothetical protein
VLPGTVLYFSTFLSSMAHLSPSLPPSIYIYNLGC